MAEKKSMTGRVKPTRRKRAVKTVASEVRPVVELVKPREINWDVIGFASAALTLVGASIFYLTGYTYLVAWYDYFGISSTQLRLPIDYIIAQSIVPLLSVTIIFF